jgi:hypothetical protein
MSQYHVAVTIYIIFQTTAFLFLPKWWKLAAVPALLVVLVIIDHSGYMGDVLAVIPLMWACGYLVLVWVVLGVTRVVQQCLRPRSPSSDQHG